MRTTNIACKFVFLDKDETVLAVSFVHEIHGKVIYLKRVDENGEHEPILNCIVPHHDDIKMLVWYEGLYKINGTVEELHGKKRVWNEQEKWIRPLLEVSTREGAPVATICFQAPAEHE